MKYLVPLCLTLFIVAGHAFAQQQPTKSREILTNDSIISLAKAGFKERTIITLIRTSQTRFDISTLRLVELKKRSVSERVISEMIEITNRGAHAVHSDIETHFVSHVPKFGTFVMI